MDAVNKSSGSAGYEKNVMMGVIAGAVGGLIASWVMNAFMEGPGQKLQQSIQGEKIQAENGKVSPPRDPNQPPPEDATMKTADAIVEAVTGGRHLSRQGKEVGGPIVHYAFGALMGACYGALAESTPAVTSGAGAAFGSALFTGADLVAVPALKLSGSGESSIASLATPFAAHLVYGMTTEAVRRVIRAIL
jgi:uncharacterized membrane protein YagU involved in acid resistance